MVYAMSRYCRKPINDQRRTNTKSEEKKKTFDLFKDKRYFFTNFFF